MTGPVRQRWPVVARGKKWLSVQIAHHREGIFGLCAVTCARSHYEIETFLMFSITRHSILLGGSGLHVPPTVGVTGVWVSIAILPSAGLEPDLGVTPRRSRPIGSNSIYTRKSHKIDHFLEILNISGDFWQFQSELKKSIEFHPYQEIPQNRSLSGDS